MAKRFLTGLGIVLLLVGLVGAFTGGHDHELIVFGINATHNMVHIVSGLLLIAFAWGGERSARLGCRLFFAVYGLVTLGGFFGIESIVSGLNINPADNFLHLAIILGCAWHGFFRPTPIVPSGPYRSASSSRDRESLEIGSPR